MKITKRLLTVCLSLLLLTVSLCPAFPAAAEDDAPASIPYIDGDGTASSGWTGVRHRTKSDGSDEKMMVPDSAHSMAAVNGFRTELLDYPTRCTIRVSGSGYDAGVRVNAIPTDDLAFAFWVYAEEEVKLNDDFYLEIGGASDGGWYMYPASGAFSTGDRTLHEGWNYFFMDFGKAIAGDKSAGTVRYTEGSGAFRAAGGSPDDPCEGSYIYFDVYNCCVTGGQERVNLWFDDLRFLNTAKLDEAVQNVTDGESLRAAAEKGACGTVRVTDTVNGAETVTVRRDLRVELGGATVRTADGPVFTVDGASLTLVGGKTERTGASCLVSAVNGAHVRLEGTMTAVGFSEAILLTDASSSVDLSAVTLTAAAEGTVNADITVNGMSVRLAARVPAGEPIPALSAFERYSDGSYDYYYRISPVQDSHPDTEPESQPGTDAAKTSDVFWIAGTCVFSLLILAEILLLVRLKKKAA